MNGSVVPMLEKTKHDEINDKLSKHFKTFYVGDELTELEKDIERQYIAEKFIKHNEYQSRRTTKHKTHWTVSDLNRYQDQKNYRMNEAEYFANPCP